MDCCNTNKKEPLNDDSKNVKGGKLIKMERRMIIWIVIGLLFLAVLFLVFKTGATGNVVQATSAAKTVATSSSGMVGGC